LFVDTTLARPGVRCRLADFSAAAIAARSSQHCLDDFKIIRGLNPERTQGMQKAAGEKQKLGKQKAERGQVLE
jgi:hypothetical protein